MTPGLLIVGGGLAAQRCCETLRAQGHDGPVTIVGPERPYDRPPLSKEACDEPPWLRPREWYAEHDVALVTATATGLRPERRTVELAGGGRLPYDRLLIATGSDPVRLPALAGFRNVQALRGFEDAARLRAALAAGARLAVVGGGLIGLEVASHARRLGAEVTVIEAAPRLLPRLGAEVGARLAALHREDGARVHLGSGVAGVRGGQAAEELVLADGTRIAADHVVEAVGVRPATAWFAGAALDDRVLLAGDVTGGGHWDAAARQGAAAARALLGLPAAPPAPPSFWSDQLGMRLQCVGDTAGARAELRADTGGRGFEAVYRREGRVTAVLLAGRSAAELRAARRRLAAGAEAVRQAA